MKAILFKFLMWRDLIRETNFGYKFIAKINPIWPPGRIPHKTVICYKSITVGGNFTKFAPMMHLTTLEQHEKN